MSFGAFGVRPFHYDRICGSCALIVAKGALYTSLDLARGLFMGPIILAAVVSIDRTSIVPAAVVPGIVLAVVLRLRFRDYDYTTTLDMRSSPMN